MAYFPSNPPATTFRVLSAATTNASSVKASPGQITGWFLANLSGTTKYIKFYNKASSPTVGTDVPTHTIPLPAGAAANVCWAPGINFSTGIALAITGGVADNDATAVALNDVIVNLEYL